jgi:hypothetical protein
VPIVEINGFSDELERWLHSDRPKSLGSLGDVFEEKSFAVATVLLMLVSSTPLPTGGITLIFQLIAAVVAMQMVFGRRTLWLPDRWRRRELGATATTRAIPFLIRRVRWLERHSSPRWAGLFGQRWFLRCLGVILFALAVFASLAPPFSGLDTLPALGAVVVALAIILEDVVVLGIGVVIGAGGIALFLAVGAVVLRTIQGWL